MNTYFPTRGARVEPRRPVPVMARDGPAEGRRERYLDWAGALMHLLAGCAFVTAGAFAGEFVLFSPTRKGRNCASCPPTWRPKSSRSPGV